MHSLIYNLISTIQTNSKLKPPATTATLKTPSASWLAAATTKKTLTTTTTIKKNKTSSIIKKNRKKHEKTLLLIKYKIGTIDLFDSYISHNEYGSENNVLKEYDVMNEAIKSSNPFDSDNEDDWYSKKKR